MKRTLVLVILDGWGVGRKDDSNPIHAANLQNFKYLEENFPHASLQASGISVGLPWGETGNSEVGHLTIGAGKVIYQFYPKITLAIRNGEFFKNEALLGAFNHAKKNNSSVNLMGLLSKGNVHASIDHLLALIKMGEENGVPVKLHLFTDGKDVPPKTLETYLSQLPQEKISSLIGRYYAMDREGNWQLTKQAYECITGEGGHTMEPGGLPSYLEQYFTTNKSEEFIPPLRFGGEEKALKDGDAAIFFNYREDSIRQIATSFIDPNFSEFPTKKFENFYVATMTAYDAEKLKAPTAFEPDRAENCLGKVISDSGLSQLRLAETYKYAHITYFFNAFREEPFPNEYRVVIPSTPIPHPDEHPEMMARPLTERLISAINERSFDFIMVNYANPDTIGHTGNFAAGQQAATVIDEEIGKVVKASLEAGVHLVITSDHGNLEEMVNPVSGRMETQHDPNPVPLYLVHPDLKGRKFEGQENTNQTLGILSDVAPTVLELMGIKKPEDMDGKSLIKNLV